MAYDYVCVYLTLNHLFLLLWVTIHQRNGRLALTFVALLSASLDESLTPLYLRRSQLFNAATFVNWQRSHSVQILTEGVAGLPRGRAVSRMRVNTRERSRVRTVVDLCSLSSHILVRIMTILM